MELGPKGNLERGEHGVQLFIHLPSIGFEEVPPADPGLVAEQEEVASGPTEALQGPSRSGQELYLFRSAQVIFFPDDGAVTVEENVLRIVHCRGSLFALRLLSHGLRRCGALQEAEEFVRLFPQRLRSKGAEAWGTFGERDRIGLGRRPFLENQ
jgi:hypothetical protein